MRLPKSPSWIHWSTPADIRECLARFGPIRLDPCWNQNSKIQAKWACDGQHLYHHGQRVLTGPQGDGLVLDWADADGEGYVYSNPPYAAGAIDLWANKYAVEVAKKQELVVLAAIRPSAAWFKTIMDAGPSVVLPVGPKRCSFENPPPPICRVCGKPEQDGGHVSEEYYELHHPDLPDLDLYAKEHVFLPEPRKDASTVESVIFYYGQRKVDFCLSFQTRGYPLTPGVLV